jgi:L-ascorbate metabolism protein UlaG (beta-lactamase superfamily)
MGLSAGNLPLVTLALMAAGPDSAGGGNPVTAAGDGPTLSYFGRSTFKLRTASGFVVYVDPYAPGDYSEAADLVLVSHGHGDHNAVAKTRRKPGSTVLAPVGAVEGIHFTKIAEGDLVTLGPVTVRGLPAANSNHPRGIGLGYLIGFDGLQVYYSGDTSSLPEMAGWSSFGIDYALLCSDGFYNMGADEASRCAALMNARHLIPIHTSKDGLFDEKVARSAKSEGLIVAAPGTLIKLAK